MARLSKTLQLTPAQSHYVLGRLLEDRQVKSSTVSKLAGEMAGELEMLEARISMLRRLTGQAPPSIRARLAGRRKSTRAVSPEVMASRRLQGQYLGLIRQIPARGRKQFKRIAAEQGREAAVNALRKTLGR